jgi:hypothetical protein
MYQQKTTKHIQVHPKKYLRFIRNLNSFLFGEMQLLSRDQYFPTVGFEVVKAGTVSTFR